MEIANVTTSCSQGDGIRFIISFQGCNALCDDCQDKSLQEYNVGTSVTPGQLSGIINREFDESRMINGITLRCGNPLEQHDLFDFLELVKVDIPGVNIWLYTPNRFDTIKDDILKHLDVVVCGEFIKSKQCLRNYYNSTNQLVYRKINNVWESDTNPLN